MSRLTKSLRRGSGQADETRFTPGRVLAFEVLGEPIPQGSNRAFVDPRTGKRVFKPDDKRLRPWRKAVRRAAEKFMDGRTPIAKQRAVLLGIEFRLDRAKTTRSTKGHYSGVYRHEMTDEQHAELLDALKGLEGMVVLSGYPNELYDGRLAGWARIERAALADGAQDRVEVLWISPNAETGMFAKGEATK